MSRLLGKKWMFFYLPRHEGKTLLTAVLTAKDLLAQPIGAVVWVDYLKDSTCLVCYYIVNFNHDYSMTENSIKSTPKCKKNKVFLARRVQHAPCQS